MWKDGRATVAVKVQYPGAGDALLADLNQLARLAGMFRVIQPGLDVKPLVAELRDADHRGAGLRAGGARRSGPSPRRTPATTEIFVPQVVAAAPRVLVTEWVDGTPLSQDHQRRAREAERDHAGRAAGHAALLRARRGPGCCTPTRTRATSGCCPTAGSACIDFGAVARLPDGHPEPIGRLTRLALAGDADGGARRAARRGLRQARRRDRRARRCSTSCCRCSSRSRPTSSGSPGPGCAAEATRLASPQSPAYQLGRQLNLPPSYLLIHRVTLGSIGVLCQLEAKAPYRGDPASAGCPASPRPAADQTHARRERPPPRAGGRGALGSSRRAVRSGVAYRLRQLAVLAGARPSSIRRADRDASECRTV